MTGDVETVLVSEVATLRRERVEVDPSMVYREVGVRSFGKGLFHKEPVTGADLGTKRVFEIRPGDLILSNVFAWEGAIAVAGEAEEGMIGSHRFMTYVVDPARADARYLRHFFLSDGGLELIRRASPGSAGRNRTLGIDAFEALQIRLPPVADQQRIADQIDRVAALAATVRDLAARGEGIAAALPASLAQRGHLSEATKRELGWRHLPLSNVIALASDPVAVEADQTYPNVGILSFGRGVFAKPPIDGSRTSAKTLYRIRARQFIYSRLFAFEGAYAAVQPQFDGSYVSNEFPTFDVDDDVAEAPFLAAYFRSREIWEELARSSKGLGVRRQRVHPDAVLQLTVWLPPVAAQRLVAEQIARLSEVHDRRARSLRLAKAFEASMLNSRVKVA